MAIYHKTLQYHEGEKQPGLPERGSENTKNGDCGTKTRILDVNITSTILTTGQD